MSERKLLYEGKAKKVFEAEEPETLVVSYKDDATAFNGLKKGTITGKGEINNRMSNLLMQMLEKSGIPTHFIKELSPRETLVKKVRILPLYLFPYRFPLHFRVVQGDLCPYLLLAGLGIQHVAAAVE